MSLAKFAILGLLVAIAVNAPLYVLLVLGLMEGGTRTSCLLAVFMAALPFALIVALALLSRFTVGVGEQRGGSGFGRERGSQEVS